jgi:signal transduction histidine kinase
MFSSSRAIAAALNRLAGSTRRPLPRRTVRLRLTALYGALFLLSGAGLLAITNLLVHRSNGTVFYISKDNVARQERIRGVIGNFSATIGVPVAVLATGPRATSRAQAAPSVSNQLASHAAGTAQLKPGPGGPLFVTSGGPARSKLIPVPSPQQLPTPQQLQDQARQLTTLATKQQSVEHNHLLVISGIALGIMAVISLALGWLVSGRVLRPLRTMITATRRISERNLHERLALQGPDDELKDLADTIDGLLVRLEAAFQAQRRFVANASHELRTPLTMMRTSLDVAVAKPAPLSPQVSALELKLREGLDQADRLLESFLTLARAEHGVLGDRSTISLSRILLAAIQDRAEAIAGKRIEVTETIVDADINGSQTLLARMVENIIENAIAHNQPGGWIHVATAFEQGAVALVVESGGPHLEQDAVAQLAQPFRRLGAERTGSERGVGLGLSIVAAIAAAHGGALALIARPEGGLRVEVRLPRPQACNALGEDVRVALAGASA